MENRISISWVKSQCKFAQSQLPSVSVLDGLKASITGVAQRVYDSWEQDENGQDPELGSGGICQDIADEIAGVLGNFGIECTTVDNGGMGEQHVWVVAQFAEGVYEIDIAPGNYERGSGYVWKKIPNVKFDPSMIHIGLLDKNPASFENYLDG